MINGWIKLWRKTMDSQVWRNSDLFKVWMYCLFKASHKQRWVSVTIGKGSSEVELLPGQFIYGRFSAGKNLLMKPESARKRMEKLQKMGNITIQSTTHYSIVTVCNWEQYQPKEEEVDQPLDQPGTTQVPAVDQPGTTNKKVKKVNNEKKGKEVTQHAEIAPLPPEQSSLSVFDSEANQGIVKALKECSYYHLLADRTEKNAKFINSLIGYEERYKFIDVLDMIIEADAYIAGKPSGYKWSSDNNNLTRERRTAGARETMRKRFSNAVRWEKEGRGERNHDR